MLQNRTITSSIASPVTSEWPASVRRARLPQQWHILRDTLRLPNSWRSFVLFTCGVAVICAGMFLHLQISTQILQDKMQLSSLQAAELAVEEENSNLVWAIAQETELNKVHERAIALGYQPSLQREYVVIPSNTLAAATNGAIAQSGE
ncbi:MAG: hypothetical protein KF832_15105 [Caldilineaceae bacterium]|nr:hypothetical protein [Caldilineaceae bacterium]